jgi:hypothetical protein
MQNLDLIDWRAVGLAALWISGLAVMLSCLGFAEFRARSDSSGLRRVLEQANYQAALGAGLAMFCLGLLGSSETWWEALAWGLLSVASLAYLAGRLRARRANGRD